MIGRQTLRIGASLLALSTSAGAWAACAPDASTYGIQVHCTDQDDDGLTIAADLVTIQVAADALIADRPDGVGSIVFQNGDARALASLFNAGSIISDRGGAIVGLQTSGLIGFGALVNDATGRIIGANGAIGVVVDQLQNAGLIDGDSGSAYGFAPTEGTYIFPSTIINSGVIRNNSGVATLNPGFGSFGIANSGQIINMGSGLVYDAKGETLSLNNAAGGLVSTTGPVALRSDFQVSIRNAGIIKGSIIGGNGFGDEIDTSLGTIDGDVLLNDGDDILTAALGIGRWTGNISGTADGGAGMDILALAVLDDNSVTQTNLPAGFERIQLNLANDAVLTLGANRAPAGGYAVRGVGTLVMGTDLTQDGPVITGSAIQRNYGEEGLTFINSHALQGSLTVNYEAAVSLSGLNSVVNSGLIKGVGGRGASFVLQGEGSVTNSGTIEGDDQGLSLSGSLINSGTIRSLGDIGLVNDLGGGVVRGKTSINSGLIEGRTNGAVISSIILVNSGTISGSESYGVWLSGSTTLDNRAGGVISGNGTAIAGSYDAHVLNAGTIHGDVDLRQPYGEANLFVDRGGIVNGNLWLGDGDGYYVADLARGLAGVNGLVNPGEGRDTLRFMVGSDGAASLGSAGTFEVLEYELENGVALSLSGIGATSLGFAGTGTVTLDADLMAAPDADAVLTIGTPALAKLLDPTTPLTGLLSLVSRGTLTLAANPSIQAGVVLSGSTGYSYWPDDRDVRFENAGTINTVGTTAISGWGDITNSGRIAVDQAIAIYSRQGDVRNSGVIQQLAGGSGSRGIYASGHVVNSGTVDTDGTAIMLGDSSGSLDNSGLLRSATDPTIMGYAYASIENRVGGRIETGASGVAIDLSYGSGGAVNNAGVIVGDIIFAGQYYSGWSSSYVGSGTVDGDIMFGAGNDIFLQMGDDNGVTGRIDGGDGDDLYAILYQSDTTVALGGRPALGFERDYIGAAKDVTVTIEAGATASKPTFVGGEGSVVNLATLDGAVTNDVSYYFYGALVPELPRTINSFINRGVLNDGLGLNANMIVNDGTIRVKTAGYGSSFSQYAYEGAFSFVNHGRVLQSPYGNAVSLTGSGVSDFYVDNSGLIDGGMDITAVLDATANGEVAILNSGTIRAGLESALAVDNINFTTFSGGRYSLINSGLIEADAQAGAAVQFSFDYVGADVAAVINNDGTIRNSGSGSREFYYDYWSGEDVALTHAASTILLHGNGTTALTLTNAASGTIEATGDLSTAIMVTNAALTLDNVGTISGGAGTVLADTDQLALSLGNPYLAGAIQTVGSATDSITNSGTIIGSIDLGFGDDAIVNRGTIIGDVYLRDGDDSFTQLASAIFQGTADGGAGIDSFIVDATGGGAVNGDQFVNFERFFQIGEGNVSYSGDFSFDTIGLDGGTITVAMGETLSSDGAITITGGAGNDTVLNAGTIGGGIALAGGGDTIVNGGTIGGPVSLGADNDGFTEQAGSSVAGLVDGGSGTDLYSVILAGDRSGVGAQTGFEQLSVEGQGTLTLGLGQGYELISLVGTNLNLTTNGQFVGHILGDDGSQQLRLTGDASSVQLGDGADALRFGLTRAAGTYDGGAGSDSLAFTAQGAVTLAGTVKGFETVSLAGGSLNVTGQLGSVDGALRFGDMGEHLDIASGGRLLGRVDMGDGDDVVRLADGALWQGIVSGGAGHDSLSLALTNAQKLDGNSLNGFESLVAQGTATLTLVNGFTLQSLSAQGDLTLANGSSLTTDSLTLGSGDNRFTINGLFAGAVDGGAGSNHILLNAGSAAAPVRFAAVSNIAGLDISSGYATVSDNAAFGRIDMDGGRLVGLAGSIIHSESIMVRQGATFGSAGTVVGDINVAGTLSPGASSAVMTVTGNVALAGGSTTLMEITPTLSDQLVVSGTLTIAQGANLVLTADQQVKPGTTLDLIVAYGGISGSYGSVVKPDNLFGFIVQDEDRIRLLGQFFNNVSFSSQVQRAIDYTNALIAAGTASDGLIDALPALATVSGASNTAAFARLTAEPYASATQMGVENGLAIANATRSIARLSAQDAPQAFSIGQYLGGLGRIAADDRAGLSASRARSYGLLGGLGIGTDRWSIAGFGGYLDSRQTLHKLGSQTDADGWFAGVAVSHALGVLRFDGTLAYHQIDADTDRLTPDGGKAHGRFRLKNWIGDASLSYEAALGRDWAARPDIGLTYVATTRTGVDEDASSVWALDVAKDKHDALLIDGGVAFERSRASHASFRPFVRLGVQYQLQGRSVEAMAGFVGADQNLLALGARRGRLVGSVSGGAEMRLGSPLSLFANASQTFNQDDRRASANVGVKFVF